MRITHSYPLDTVSRTISPSLHTGFMLARNGDFFSAFQEPTSRYQGWFARLNGEVWKIVDAILVREPDARVKEIRNNFSYCSRIYGSLTETFSLPREHGLLYELSDIRPIEIVLDTRGIYDAPVFGRRYSATRDKELYVIHYRHADERSVFIAFVSDSEDYRAIDEWRNTFYPLDAERASEPSTYFRYHALSVTARRLAIGVASSKEEAVMTAREVFAGTRPRMASAFLETSPIPVGVSHPEIAAAYYAAQSSLRDLLVSEKDHTFLMAGLPWFFQHWERDELISLAGLPRDAQEKILSQYLENTAFSSTLASSDALGWLFYRASEHEKKAHLFRLPFFFLDPYERDGAHITWMDSIPERNGRRIEIMALVLAMYRAAYQATKDTYYRNKESDLLTRVRTIFWNGRTLNDGENDPTIRPNLFIAAYVYPDLLSRDEWIQCFENTLSSLWLSWGGLSTIDMRDPRFTGRHSGQDPKSYHNGDSWFFLNNLAALVLHRTDARRFKPYVDTITAASTREMLWSGCIGRPSELSSAEMLRSEGCWLQAWSAALYLELIRETSRII